MAVGNYYFIEAPSLAALAAAVTTDITDNASTPLGGPILIADDPGKNRVAQAMTTEAA